MRKFIYKIIYLSLPLILSLILVNYFGDAAKLFHSGYELKMANIIQNGSYVTNITNYDERIFQKEIILLMEESPDVVVVGSSRTMLIESSIYANNSFFNNSVSGATLNDLIAIYQLYKANDLNPKKIILGIDPWMFNENNRGSRWKSLEQYYNSFYSNEKSSSNFNFLYKYYQLFSISYFQASVKNIGERYNSSSEPKATNSKYNTTITKLLDGSLVYNNAYRNASQAEVDMKIFKYAEAEIYGLKGFDQVSRESIDTFKELAKDIKLNNIELELFLAPYPPKSYDVIIEKYPAIMVLETLINDYAKSEKVNVLGSFNPLNYQLDETYFYDGMHCKEEAISRIIVGK